MGNQQRVIAAIDGPAGAGKSTVAKAVAQVLGYALVDTGAIYRAVALLAKRKRVAWDDDPGLEALVRGLKISFVFQEGINRVWLGQEDVTDLIRTPEISKGASQISLRPCVRAGLLGLQRQLAGQGGAVVEGRDIGTVVCPQAPIKFFLDASDEERARRRYRQQVIEGKTPHFDNILRELRERDTRDRQRSYAPLVPARDAVLLDSTQMPISEVIQTIVKAVQQAEQRLQLEPSPPDF